MGARTIARQAALMMLYAVDAVATDPDEVIRHYFSQFAPAAELSIDLESRAYAEDLLRGISSKQAELDRLLKEASRNWRIERMTRVDRNIMRLAAWELLQGVPSAVAIDEAVELAKLYGSEESPAFVNGVLDRLAESLASKPTVAS